jgi:hypothetical protein
MHTEILTREQEQLLDFLRSFKRGFYLVGGTAIALQMGHRRSIDFDLFTMDKIKRLTLRRRAEQSGLPCKLLGEDSDQIHFVLNNVKVTFFSYPYAVEHPVLLGDIISMPTLLSLAAMKAFALGRRAKWKDYVDLCFLIRDHFSVPEIIREAQRLFGDSFSDRLFRGQLTYHADIDYAEAVEFMPGFEIDAETVKAFLIDKALEGVVETSGDGGRGTDGVQTACRA